MGIGNLRADDFDVKGIFRHPEVVKQRIGCLISAEFQWSYTVIVFGIPLFTLVDCIDAGRMFDTLED